MFLMFLTVWQATVTLINKLLAFLKYLKIYEEGLGSRPMPNDRILNRLSHGVALNRTGRLFHGVNDTIKYNLFILHLSSLIYSFVLNYLDKVILSH